MGDGVPSLEPCGSCGRHVRVSEAACPFCGAALDVSGMPPQLLPNERLSRSALFSFRTLVGAGVIGATTSAVLGACVNVTPVYGAPCNDDCLFGVEDAGDGAAETGAGGNAGKGGAPSEGGAGGEGGR